MAATSIIPSSFVYEDLVSKVQIIQNQIFNIQDVLNNRWKNEKRKRDELKSRSLVFIDPYGNRTINKYMDHEFIHTIIQKYKKDYVPKYLQKWIKIGIMKENMILSLNNYELKSTVSHFVNGYEFMTYGEVIVWIEKDEHVLFEKMVLRVMVTDSIEKVKEQLKQHREFDNIELKSCITNAQPNEENWNEGTILKSEDTVMSCQLYEENCIIMGKLTKEKDKTKDSSNSFCLFVKIMNAKPVKLYVNSTMNMSALKELIQNNDGFPLDMQRLIFAGKQLEDERTLSDYNIQTESTIHLLLRLQGGMYHFTSGRRDFESLPDEFAQAVKNILTFKVTDVDQNHHVASAELQEFVLKAHSILSDLHRETKELYTSPDVLDLKKIILPTIDNNEDSSIDENDDTSSNDYW